MAPVDPDLALRQEAVAHARRLIQAYDDLVPLERFREGFLFNGPSEDQQATINRMSELRARGRTYREIARAVTDEGYAPPSGDEWHGPTVFRILKREDTYAASRSALQA